uniref:Orf162 n=1 Tax=Spizellomyces punctatus TaxID=109760 RepID=Q950Q3_SPIPN|nr:orf162 [Spizellomyces punctatus]AAK84255.1 orf162 [Spizellomyces punctatus]
MVQKYLVIIRLNLMLLFFLNIYLLILYVEVLFLFVMLVEYILDLIFNMVKLIVKLLKLFILEIVYIFCLLLLLIRRNLLMLERMLLKGDFPHEFASKDTINYIGPHPNKEEGGRLFDFRIECLRYLETAVKLLVNRLNEHEKHEFNVYEKEKYGVIYLLLHL